MSKLYFYYSAMNAGKSTTLLQSSYNYIERGMETLLFCPKFDVRYGDPKITSRIGLSQDAILFNEETRFFDLLEIKKEQIQNLRCILIDEAHFLKKKHIEALVAVTTKLNLPVLCYGLRSDFLGEPFEGSKYLLSWADELIEIKTICHCGKKATMNLRLDENSNAVIFGNQVHIGGNDTYVSLCRYHFDFEIEKSKSLFKENARS